MRTFAIIAACYMAAMIPCTASADGGSITGFAFVDSSVTGMGSRAELPAGTKVYPPGSKSPAPKDAHESVPHRWNDRRSHRLPGPSNRRGVTITEHPATGGSFERAPYYIDLDSGRTLQYLGPMFSNGTYDVLFSYSYNLGAAKKSTAELVLARSCR